MLPLSIPDCCRSASPAPSAEKGLGLGQLCPFKLPHVRLGEMPWAGQHRQGLGQAQTPILSCQHPLEKILSDTSLESMEKSGNLHQQVPALLLLHIIKDVTLPSESRHSFLS